MASTISVPNETRSSSVRTTKDGRNIRYSLQVIQQPERARACGSGAKSSADRRPVDPPPIVELKVFEGEQDITFGYNANFFLFATLENARTIAPGRAPAATPSFPVLTGTPVAGMAYLDRPSPAGYFIFPDLSVRHEGKYRLSFALYEELKDQKDMDPEDRSVNAHTQGGLDAHVSHRLEVKSAPFVVFSAKKFPGLSESTALSRMVAEQGCRVRIRRDVRMRRRENKANKDWDEYDDEGGYEGARRTSSTPDTYAQQQGMPTTSPALDADNRPRSVSNASNTSFAPPRRQSMEEMQPAYQPNSYQQMPPPQSASYSQVPQYNAPQPAYQNQYAPPQPAAPLMQPPQTSYSQQSHQPAHSYQSQSNMHMSQPYGYMNNQSYQQQSHYEQPAPVRQEPAVDYSQPAPDYRRSSIAQPTQQYPGPSQIMPSYGSGSMDYGRPQQMVQPLQSPNHIAPVSSSSAHMPTGHALAPLRTVLADAIPQNKLEPVSPSYQSPPNNMSAPMSATSEIAPHHAYLDKYNTQPQVQPQASIGQKRSYSSTFDTRHLDDRLQGGARPNPTAPPYRYDGVMDNGSPDMEEPMDRSSMSYRRADGSHRSRRVPELGV
ncbi:velum formation-related protein [Paraconiothyrium brasiliense]|uniref:Velum formation-related protein n=1 Tax=Paraconiothyrium brasiliense TaxID=300254 RepID=A0ABR3RD47_9PLEO